MMKHVVLLTDAHEATAIELAAVLRDAGVIAFVEVMRESESPVPVDPDLSTPAQFDPPLAVLYEVVPGAESRELYAVIEHANTVWPGAPLVACRRQPDDKFLTNLRTLDSTTLKRLGFRAIADEPAQLPALLRDLESRGGITGELNLPKNLASDWLPGALLLPENISREKLRSAFELVSSLHFTNDQTSAANTALAGLGPLVEADRWTIYLSSDSGGNSEPALEPLAVRGTVGDNDPSSEQNWKLALLANAVVLSGNESKAARAALAKARTIKKTERGQRCLAVPLISNDRVMGVLEGIRSGSHKRMFTRTSARVLEALALPIASALGNSLRIAEAERLSQTDDLTKLHNARYLRQYLLNEVKRARRYNTNAGALFLDLDDFKNVNDAHGHLVGSHVLMEMATIILSSVRDTDVVARYGGDEFVVILPESNLEQAAFVAERVREKIARHAFRGGRSLRLHLTASFGVATFPEDAQSPQQLVAKADAAMYEAKAAGKNCVRFAGGAEVSEPIDVATSENRRGSDPQPATALHRPPTN